MSVLLERVREGALGLPEPERLELIHELIDSLAGEPDAEIEAAWSAEIRRRIGEVEEGKVECISHEEVMAKARRALGCK